MDEGGAFFFCILFVPFVSFVNWTWPWDWHSINRFLWLLPVEKTANSFVGWLIWSRVFWINSLQRFAQIILNFWFSWHYQWVENFNIDKSFCSMGEIWVRLSFEKVSCCMKVACSCLHLSKFCNWQVQFALFSISSAPQIWL